MPLSDRQRIVLETIAARDRAEATLQALRLARAEAERAPEAEGRSDLFKEVTGRSALDNAIAQTRRMVETLNTALEQAQRDLAAEPALAHAAGA